MPRLRALTVSVALLVPVLAGCSGRAPDPPTPVPPPPAAPTPVASAAAPGPVNAAARSPAPDPSPATASADPSASPSATKAAAEPGRYVFPVKASNASYHPTHSKYPATDIFANCGSPVLAVTDGTVLEVSRKDVYVKGEPDGPNNGGLSVSILGVDGVRYYGSHLSRIADGIGAGVTVKAGRQLGDVGRTGNANNVCHLHFGISPPCAKVGDWKVRRGVIWPAPYLDSWRRNGSTQPVDKAAAWAKDHDCQA